MNALTRWDPFRELEDMQSRLSSFLARRPQRRENGEKETMTVAEWAPLVDITEDDKEYVIKAELPEINKDDIKVTVQNDMLLLSGERKFEKEEQGKKYHRIERAYGSFMRSFDLPDNADPEKIHAEFRDGVLRVHVAKTETALPKQIEVS
jgi:HSP20 family protein